MLELEQENARLRVEKIALENAVGNLRALLPDLNDDGVVEKISELQRLREAVEWTIWALEEASTKEWPENKIAQELRRRAGKE